MPRPPICGRGREPWLDSGLVLVVRGGLAAVVGVLLASCSSPSHLTGAAPGSAGDAAASGPVATAPAVPACTTRQLAPHARYVTNGASHESFVLTFTNRGATCTLRGEPTFVSRDGTGKVVERSTASANEAPAGPLIHLHPGATASASYSVDVGVPPSCGPYSAVTVIAPGASDEVRVPSIPTSDSGLRPCRYTSGPLYPGLKGSPNAPG